MKESSFGITYIIYESEYTEDRATAFGGHHLQGAMQMTNKKSFA